MPLRQSTLSFGFHASTSPTVLPEIATKTTLQSTISSFIDTDTIVVNTSDTNPQLPTPSDTATDVSSESSRTVVSGRMSKSRSKRTVAARTRKSAFQEDLTITVNVEHDKNRSVSGETLVPEEATARQSSLLQTSVKAFDLPWSMGDVFSNNSKEGMAEEKSQEDEVGSVITVREEVEDEEIREERRVAKKAKMGENAKRWEERKKAAEQNATRRSGRASLISKANELFDNIKDTVLGKRSRSGTDKEEDTYKPGMRPRSAAGSLSGSLAKKPHMSEADAVADKSAAKKSTTRREKKWLISGLYAGQPRKFDARLTEHKNKWKSQTVNDIQTRENTVLPLPMFAGERLLQYGRDFKLPFDVFSPLPAGQPKPDEWKKVNKNVFVGDAAAEWRTSKFIEHSTCLCKSPTGCDQDCMNRYMYYECDERNCNLGELECGNRAFEGLKTRAKIGGKFNVGVEVIKTMDRGYGVRSNRTFDPNQIIVEYTGEIITQEECEQRMRTIYKDNACYYLMLFDQNMIIDATRGSIARFVNHSCEPNCRMEKWTVGGKPRMALFAGDRGIMTGEELTYDYNFDPYSQKNVQECRCGANNCRGVLGPKPKPEIKRNSPEKEVGKKKEGKMAGTKRKIAHVLEEGTNKMHKKRKLTSMSKKTDRSLVKAHTGAKSTRRAALVKNAAARKVSLPNTKAKLGRSDSKLKKMIIGAKSKAGSMKDRRVTSTSSATQPLLGEKKKKKKGEQKKSTTIVRTLSLKEKAKSVTRSVRARSQTITVAG